MHSKNGCIIIYAQNILNMMMRSKCLSKYEIFDSIQKPNTRGETLIWKIRQRMMMLKMMAYIEP